MNDQLIQNSNKVFLDNFPNETHFERAIFFSWSCSINDCKFCYMSTKPRVKEHNIRRSLPSILAEAILTKNFGWEVGFLSGGVGAFFHEELLEMLKYITEIINDKVWINIGVVSETQLKSFLPYIKGVIGTVECVNKEVHDFVCPSKPSKPIEIMFQNALKLGIKTGMTLILGLGEKKDDFPKLKWWITKYSIEKIHIYGLNPIKGTYFENKPPPEAEYHAWWIANTRINFPKIDLQAGIWENKIEHVPLLLKAGANSVSKFPALKVFGTKTARELELAGEKAGRIFKGTLTKLPEIDWYAQVQELKMPTELKAKVYFKIKQYLKRIEKNLKKPSIMIYDD